MVISPDSVAPRPLDRLIVLDEIDRGRVAERLHDGLVQDLLAARYLADLALAAATAGADVTALAARLEDIRAAAAGGLAASKALMSELTARATDGRNLAGALRSASAAVHTGDDSDAELPPVPPAIAVVAHRLVRALTTRGTSANPPGVRGSDPGVSVRHSAGSLRISCTAAAQPGPDLAGWLERAAMLGAAISRDDGLLIEFSLPAIPEGS